MYILMQFIETLTRDEMKNVKAGDQVYIRCEGCQNSTCQGFYDGDCYTGAYEMCGPGYAGTSRPAAFTCIS